MNKIKGIAAAVMILGLGSLAAAQDQETVQETAEALHQSLDLPIQTAV